MSPTAPTAHANVRVDPQRLWDSLMAMAEIGATPGGGCNRQALTQADRQGRDLLAGWAKAAGLTLTVDTMGTMFARRAGSDPDLPPVLVGSHLDTQPTGGRYDGVLGVLAALEVVRTLDDLGIRTRHPIEVVNWTNEEGARFAPAMLGSGVFAGVLTQAFAEVRCDRDGVRFGEALDAIGWRGTQPAGQHPAHAYLELHIEQGPVLEAEGLDIGIVTHGQGLRWLQVTLTGRDAHTGTTPMDRRRDGLLCAAAIVQAANRVALAHGPAAVATVGQLEVQPNSRNTIAGRVSLCIDLRSPDAPTLHAMEAAMTAEVARAAAASGGVTASVEVIEAVEPVAFDPALVDQLRAIASRLGWRHRDIISGAGHDAFHMARILPTAMIFCPCVDGLSHNEAEAIHFHWAQAGADMLLHAVLEVAGVVD